MHGRGIFRWNDGRTYEGDFVNDRKEGQGVLVWKDGRKYDGQWKNGKQDGFGFYTDEKGTQRGKWVEEGSHPAKEVVRETMLKENKSTNPK